MTFDEYLDARLPALLRFATVLTCDPHLAQDVVQEALVRAHDRWSRIAGLAHPEAYLKKMITNEFLATRRGWRVFPYSREAMEEVGGVTDPTGQVADRSHALTLIAGLPPKQRAVIALRYYESLPDREIAELLGCGEGTVRSHASRALATLRANLTREEVQ